MVALVAGVLLAGTGAAAKDPPQPAKSPAAKVDTIKGGAARQPSAGEKKTPGKPDVAKAVVPKATEPAPGKPGAWKPAASASVSAAKPADVKRRAGRGKQGSRKAARAQPPKPAEIVRGDEPSGPGIRVSDDITMVPNGRDTTGCQRYSMSSRGFGPVLATFYRTQKGDFTTDRNEAACSG